MKQMNLNDKPNNSTGCKICTEYSVGISCLFMRLDKCTSVCDLHGVI